CTWPSPATYPAPRGAARQASAGPVPPGAARQASAWQARARQASAGPQTPAGPGPRTGERPGDGDRGRRPAPGVAGSRAAARAAVPAVLERADDLDVRRPDLIGRAAAHRRARAARASGPDGLPDRSRLAAQPAV